MFRAIARRPEAVSRFLAAIGGAIPIDQYFGGRNLLRLVGPAGMVRMMVAGGGRRRTAAVVTGAQPT